MDCLPRLIRGLRRCNLERVIDKRKRPGTNRAFSHLDRRPFGLFVIALKIEAERIRETNDHRRIRLAVFRQDGRLDHIKPSRRVEQAGGLATPAIVRDVDAHQPAIDRVGATLDAIGHVRQRSAFFLRIRYAFAEDAGRTINMVLHFGYRHVEDDVVLFIVEFGARHRSDDAADIFAGLARRRIRPLLRDAKIFVNRLCPFCLRQLQ